MTDTSPFDPDLAIAKRQIDERIAQHKREARRAIGKVAGHIDREEILPPERKQAIRSLSENLDQQIAGIESASHETLASARRQIGDGISKLKAELAAAIKSVQSHPAGSLHESAANCARAMDKLDAGLKAAEEHMVSAVKKK
jgi:hypothetical protein